VNSKFARKYLQRPIPPISLAGKQAFAILDRKSIRTTPEQAGQLVAENRPNLKEFTDRGLPELAGLIEDATRTVNELDGTLKDLRQDPSRFLFGNQTQQGVRAR
jgi:ABC-type transporter Mla subunit MlaD